MERRKYYFWQPTTSENLGRLIVVTETSADNAKLRLAAKWSDKSVISLDQAETMLSEWNVVGPITPEVIS